MKLPRARTLSFYLGLGLIGLALLPGLIMIVIGETEVRSRLSRELITTNRLLSKAIAESVATFLEPAESALLELVAELRIFGLGTGYNQVLLDSKQANFRYFESIQILDGAGRVVMCSPFNADHIGNTLAGQEPFTGACAYSGTYFSRSFISFQTQQPTVALSRYDRDSDSVIVGYLNLDRLGDSISVFLKETRRHIRIMDSAGTIIASHAPHESAQRSSLRYVISTRDGLNASGPVSFEESGRRYLGSLTSLPTARWSVLVASDQDEVLDALARVRESLAWGLLASLLVCGLLGYLLRRGIMHPLAVLRDNVRRLRDHDYSGTRHEPVGFLEFETLLGEFHQMQTTVDERERDLNASIGQRDLLLKEVHHRVKNNLQVISSLLHLQQSVARDEGEREILRESSNRVFSMSLIHQKLYQSSDFAHIELGQYLRELVGAVFASYRGNPSLGLSVEAAEIMVDIDTAIPLGLLANEIVSNSLKHAFASGGAGRIYVRLSAQAGSIELELGDDGDGWPADRNPDKPAGLGLQLIDALIGQLGARCRVSSSPGTVYSLLIPVIRPAKAVDK